MENKQVLDRPHCFSSIQMRVFLEHPHSFCSTGLQHVQPDTGALAFSAWCQAFWFDFFTSATDTAIARGCYLSCHKRHVLLTTTINFICEALFIRESQGVTYTYKVKENQHNENWIRTQGPRHWELKWSSDWRKGEFFLSGAVFYYI